MFRFTVCLFAVALCQSAFAQPAPFLRPQIDTMAELPPMRRVVTDSVTGKRSLGPPVEDPGYEMLGPAEKLTRVEQHIRDLDDLKTERASEHANDPLLSLAIGTIALVSALLGAVCIVFSTGAIQRVRNDIAMQSRACARVRLFFWDYAPYAALFAAGVVLLGCSWHTVATLYH